MNSSLSLDYGDSRLNMTFTVLIRILRLTQQLISCSSDEMTLAQLQMKQQQMQSGSKTGVNETEFLKYCKGGRL